MAENNVAVNQYIRTRTRFADIFNAFIFDGRQVITPDSLRPIDSESDIIAAAECQKIISSGLSGDEDTETEGTVAGATGTISSDKKRKKTGRALWRYRDIIMEWRGTILMLLACETQDKVHYAMPVRNMLYDALSYTDQMGRLWDTLSPDDKKGISDGEFFARFRKGDRLCPVVTIVLHYGETEWDGSRSLYEMFGAEAFGDDVSAKLLKKYVPDYKINLIEVDKIKNLSLFKTDLALVFGLVQCRQSMAETMRFAEEHREFFESVDYETMNAISAMTNGGERFAKLTNEGKVFNMCKAYREMYEEGVEHGRAAGHAAGLSEGLCSGRDEGIRKSIIMLRNVGTSDEVITGMIMDMYDMSVESVWEYMA